MTTIDRRVALHLDAPVHVHAAGEVLPVRRRGLAILVYVALEGPTRREQLADVLWDHRGALRNLRVELHRLRSAFAPIGVEPLRKAVDPLALTPAIDVAQKPGKPGFLVGLDDISPEYQSWLEQRRHLAEQNGDPPARTALLDELADRVRAPFVVIVQGSPGAGRRTLARALARRLRLPYLEDLHLERPALRYVAPAHHTLGSLPERISRDQNSVWVIGCSTFGEDSHLLLQVRAGVPADRLRFVTLAPLTWLEAKHSLLEGVQFHEAAGLYLAADGHPGYLTELLELRKGGALATPLPVPQRLRAAIALEARYLDERARKALERLAVHRGTCTSTLVDVLDATDSIDELERAGWVQYDGAGWSFRDPLAAKLLRAGLEPGYRLRLQQVIAAHVRTGGEHTVDPGPRDADDSAPPSQLRRPGPSANEPAVSSNGHLVARRVRRGHEILVEPPRSDADDIEFDGALIAWSRIAPLRRGDGVSWHLPSEAHLVRVKGHAQVSPEDDCAQAPQLGVLRLCVNGVPARDVTIGRVEEPRVAADGVAWLPAEQHFDHWFLVPAGSTGLHLTSETSGAVIEVELVAYRAETAVSNEGDAVEAWDLALRHDPNDRSPFDRSD